MTMLTYFKLFTLGCISLIALAIVLGACIVILGTAWKITIANAQRQLQVFIGGKDNDKKVDK